MVAGCRLGKVKGGTSARSNLDVAIAKRGGWNLTQSDLIRPIKQNRHEGTAALYRDAATDKRKPQ